MELSWLMRIRIIVSLAIGVVLLGLLPWNLVKPEAQGVFAILSGSISISDLLICAGIAFAAGFLSSAICTPYGMQTGILAAPAGLVVWGLKSAPLSKIFQETIAVQERMKVYSSLKFEGFIWLVIVVCGLLGAFLADKLFRKKPAGLPDKFDAIFKLPIFVTIPIAVIGTILVGNFLINILAGDVSYSDPELGRVTGQPANLQIAFAVMVAFMVCAFLAKLFAGTTFLWSAVASAPLTYYAIIGYSRKSVIEHLANAWPAVFFAKPAAAVLPVQMVAFACLGAVWGYWLAVRYHLWRTYEG